MFQSNRKRANKWGFTALALLLAIAMLAGCGKKDGSTPTNTPSNNSEALATYKDGGTVTKAEFDAFLNVSGMLNPMYKQFLSDPSLHQEILKQLIGFKILAGRADDEAKKQADELMAPQLEQVKEWLEAQGGLDKQLADNKITLKDLEDYAKMSFYAMAGVEKQITDDQAKAEYDEILKATKNVFDITTVRHILIAVKDEKQEKDIRTFDEALAKAKEVQEKLKNGGDFDALAKEYSDDPGSKDKGGKYADLSYGDMNGMVPEFAEAGFTLPVNQISEPIKTSFGYHVMRVDSRTTRTFEEMKQAIRSSLAQDKMSEFIENEVPGLIEKNNLPSPSPEPSASPEATPAATPEATPAATPEATQAATPSATPAP